MPQERVPGHIQALPTCGIQLLVMIKPISLYFLAVLTGVDHSVICLEVTRSEIWRMQLLHDLDFGSSPKLLPLEGEMGGGTLSWCGIKLDFCVHAV